MTSRKLASAAAAASLVGVAVLGMSAPALAQTSPCYPPPCASSISDTTVVPGQTVTAQSGSVFSSGDVVTVAVLGLTFTVQADVSGNATASFTVPADAQPGRASVVFTSGTVRAEVPFTVVAAAAAGPGQGQRSGLPLTGADQLIPLTVAGVALVGIGAGIVVASRRRRETSMPGGLA